MRKIKKYGLISMFFFILQFLFYGCSLYKTYKISGNLEIFKHNLDVKKDKKGIEYALVKEGFKMVLEIDYTKLDASKKFINAEIKMGSSAYEVIPSEKAQTYQVKGDVELRANYEEYDYEDIKYNSPEYDGVLKFSWVKEKDDKILAPAIRQITRNGKTILQARVGSKIKYEYNLEHEYFRKNNIESVQFQNKVSKPGDVVSVEKLVFNIKIVGKDNGKGVDVPQTEIAKLNQYNIQLLKTEDGNYKFYPGMDLKFNLINYQSPLGNSKVLDKIKIGEKTYEISEGQKELVYKFNGDIKEFNFEVVEKDAKAYELILKNPGNFDVLVNNKPLALNQKLYKRDEIKLTYKNFGRDTRLKSVLVNNLETLNELDKLNQEYIYKFIVDGKVDKYEVNDIFDKLEKKSIVFDENSLYLKTKTENILQSPYYIYAFEEVELVAKTPTDPSKKVKALKINEKVINGASYILKVKESDPSLFNVETILDNLSNFYKLTIENPNYKDILLVNGSTPDEYYHKVENKKLTFSFSKTNYIFKYYLIEKNGVFEKVNIDDKETFEIDYTDSDINIKFEKESIRRKIQQVDIDVDDELFDLGEYKKGLQDIKIGTTIKIKSKDSNIRQVSIFNKYIINGVDKPFSGELKEISVVVDDVQNGIFKIEIPKASVIIRNKINIDLTNFLNHQDIVRFQKVSNASFENIDISEGFIWLSESEKIKVLTTAQYYIYKIIKNGQEEILKDPVKEYIIETSNLRGIKLERKHFLKVKNLENNSHIDALTSDKIGNKIFKLESPEKVKYSYDESDNAIYKNFENKLVFAKQFQNKTCLIYDDSEIIEATITVKLDIRKMYLETQGNNFVEKIKTYSVGKKNIFDPVAKVSYIAYDPVQGSIVSYETYDVENTQGFNLTYKITALSDNRLLYEGEDYEIKQGYKLDFSKFDVATNGKVKVEWKFRDDEFSFPELEVVETGYNVYTQSEIENYFSKKDTENILLHRNILLKHRKDQLDPVHPQFTDEFLQGLNDPNYDFLKKHIGEPKLGDGGRGSYFIRDLYLAKELTFNGNGFELNAKNTPHQGFKKTDYLPYAVADVSAGIFGIDSSKIYNSQITTIKNLKLFGNTGLPGSAGAFDESNVPAWGSSGLHGIYANEAHLKLENNDFSNFVIGVMHRLGQGSVISNRFDNCWGNGYMYRGITTTKISYTYDELPELNYVSHVWFEKNYFGSAGGSAITSIDYSVNKRGDAYLNRPDAGHDPADQPGAIDRDILHKNRMLFNHGLSDDELRNFKLLTPSKKYFSWSMDPSYTFKGNTFENYINGASSYYSALGLSSAATIISSLTPVFKQLNQYGIKKSHINNDKNINFVMLLQNGSIFEKPDSQDPLKHTSPRHDISYIDENNQKSRRYYDDNYWKKNPIVEQIARSANGLLIGAGYDVNELFDKMSAAIGGGQIGAKDLYGAALAYSVSGNILNPALTNYLPFGGSATSLSKRYVELLPTELLGNEVPASFIFGLFDQLAP